jgi:hypothetical protein
LVKKAFEEGLDEGETKDQIDERMLFVLKTHHDLAR